MSLFINILYIYITIILYIYKTYFMSIFIFYKIWTSILQFLSDFDVTFHSFYPGSFYNF